MLLFRSHWRFATERTPGREARLLCFANGGTDASDPAQNTEHFAAAGFNPDGSPIAAEAPGSSSEARAGDPHAQVIEGVAQARGQIAHTVGSGTHAPETHLQEATPVNVQKAVNETLGKVGKLHESMVEMTPVVPQLLESKSLVMWQQNEVSLAMLLTQIHSLKNYSDTIMKWTAGGMPPSELINNIDSYVREYYPERGHRWGDMMGNARTFLQERIQTHGDVATGALQQMRGPDHGHGPDHAATHNASTHIDTGHEVQNIVHGTNEIIGLKENILQPIMDELAAMEKAIAESKIEDFINKVKEVELEKNKFDKAKEPADQTLVQKLRGVPEKFGLKFYSAFQIYEAGKQVFEAYKEAWHARSHHKSAELAVYLGKIGEKLPYGQDVEQVLESNIQRHDDEVKNKYVEFLKSRNVGFPSLFVGHHNLMDANRNDPNRGRGVIEYAASKGWLYDIDEIQFDGAQDKRFFGRFRLADFCPPDWNDERIEEYFYKLLGQNKQGAEAEENNTYSRIKDRENIPAFIQNLDKEMDGINLWSAMGVCKRAMERGLWPEVSPWMAVTIMRKMQDPNIRPYIPKTWLDKVGSLAFYHSAFTLGTYKDERNTLDEWLRRGNAEDLSGAGKFGQALIIMRDEVSTKADQDFSQPEGIKKLDHYCARAFAGEVLQFPGGTVSIFDRKFESYRRESTKQQGDLTPGVKDEDPDYFTQTTDNLIAGSTPVEQIFGRTGQGTFQNEDKTQHYAGNIFREYRKLQSLGLDPEATAFRLEMGAKVSGWLLKTLGDARTTGLARYKAKEKGKETSDLIVSGLVKEGFIPIEPLAYTLWVGSANSGQGLAEEALKQIDEGLLNSLRAGKKSMESKSETEKSAKLFEIVETWKASAKGGTLREIAPAEFAPLSLVATGGADAAAAAD